MAYIPRDWIKNPDNEERLHEILDFLQIDVVTEEIAKQKEALKQEVLEMGETEVYNRLIAAK